MNWSTLIHTSHRWLGVALIVLTIANAVVFGLGHAFEWLYYLPLLPLFLLMLSGTYLFVRPYLTKSLFRHRS